MPPKKKTKIPSRVAPVDADSSLPETVTFDGWTDEQETTLFKAISVYRLKPAGMHKHFRIIGISELMKNHGVSDTHTNIEGIWRKLQSLYNLEGLDEREDLFEDDGTPDPSTDFTLPDDDYGAMMTARRLDPRSIDSPIHAPTLTFSSVIPRGKKGRVIRSVSADESQTARTNSMLEDDDTEDELSMKSVSPVPRKIKPISTRGRRSGPITKTRGRGGLKARIIASPRRKATKPVALSSKDASSSDPPSDSPSDSSSPEPEKPEKPEKPQKNAAQKRTGKDKRSTDQSDDDDDDDDDDDELSDVPDELDDDDVGTVVETEGTDAGGDDASEMGESTTAAESPVPAVSSRGKGTGRGRGGGRGGRGKRGGKRGGDVRRSTRRKQ